MACQIDNRSILPKTSLSDRHSMNHSATIRPLIPTSLSLPSPPHRLNYTSNPHHNLILLLASPPIEIVADQICPPPNRFWNPIDSTQPQVDDTHFHSVNESPTLRKFHPWPAHSQREIPERGPPVKNLPAGIGVNGGGQLVYRSEGERRGRSGPGTRQREPFCKGTVAFPPRVPQSVMSKARDWSDVNEQSPLAPNHRNDAGSPPCNDRRATSEPSIVRPWWGEYSGGENRILAAFGVSHDRMAPECHVTNLARYL